MCEFRCAGRMEVNEAGGREWFATRVLDRGNKVCKGRVLEGSRPRQGLEDTSVDKHTAPGDPVGCGWEGQTEEGLWRSGAWSQESQRDAT